MPPGSQVFAAEQVRPTRHGVDAEHIEPTPAPGGMLASPDASGVPPSLAPPVPAPNPPSKFAPPGAVVTIVHPASAGLATTKPMISSDHAHASHERNPIPIFPPRNPPTYQLSLRTSASIDALPTALFEPFAKGGVDGRIEVRLLDLALHGAREPFANVG